MKTGILLINLGTPDSPKKSDVRAYLKEFLSDPRVIDISSIARWFLLHAVILPFRPKKTAEAYEKIWTEQGSPLLINTQVFAEELQKKLGAEIKVAFGMRYGKPSIATAIEQLSGCEKIIVLPLFPQYASAATGSALEQVLKIYAGKTNIPELQIIQDFFDQDFFINPYATLIHKHLDQFKPDFILFSYHGLPERQIEKSGCKLSVCDRQQNCPIINEKNRFCYRAQCYATTKALTAKLNLTENQFTTSFQSRLGRTPWIKPYTDEVLIELRRKNIKRLAIVCPSFTADCLETLEEIAIRGKEQWSSLGGEALFQVPCLNADINWVEAIAKQF